VVAYASHPGYKKKLKIGRSQSWLAWANVRPYLQNNQNKKNWVSKQWSKILCSNSSTTKTQKGKTTSKEKLILN
jgi:hypothetical protein